MFVRHDGSPIFRLDDEWWLTEFDKRKAPEPRTDLAGDNVRDEDFTTNANEAGSVSSDTGSADESCTGSDDGLPRGPLRSKRPVTTEVAASGSGHGRSVQKTQQESASDVSSQLPRGRICGKTGGGRTHATARATPETILHAPQELAELVRAAPTDKLQVSLQLLFADAFGSAFGAASVAQMESGSPRRGSCQIEASDRANSAKLPVNAKTGRSASPILPGPSAKHAQSRSFGLRSAEVGTAQLLFAGAFGEAFSATSLVPVSQAPQGAAAGNSRGKT